MESETQNFQMQHCLRVNIRYLVNMNKGILMSDDQKPITHRSTLCFEKLKSSFTGDILDNVPLYQSKTNVPENQKAYIVVASQDLSEPIGYLMNEFEQTIASRCSSGEITASTLLAKVKL